MWKLEDCKAIFIAVGLIGVLLIAFPSLVLVLRLPSEETFSELWVLGPGHMAEGYPFNVAANVTYSVYLGVENHVGSSAYYGVYVKLRNQSEASPNSTAGTPTLIPALYEYRAFLEEGKRWEAPLTFSFSDISIVENRSMVRSVAINDFVVNVDQSAVWDEENTGYYYQLFMELSIYNLSSSAFQYHNRFVGIWLNMTG